MSTAVAESLPLRVVLYEGGGAQSLEADERFSILEALLADGIGVHCTADADAVHDDGVQPMLVLGHFDGAAPQAVVEHGDSELQFADIAGMDSAGVIDLVRARADEVNDKRRAWKPWFPVVDYERCTNCMQCMTFCLFDVYSVDGDDKLVVQNPTNCKTDCPACSRVCPEVAIVFPKYRGGPINGDQVKEEFVEHDKVKVDISALLGGDIYSALRTRTEQARERFAKERDDDRALKERKRCLDKLKKLQEGLDIPDEVLAALPSLEDIQAKHAQKLAERTDSRS